MNFQGGWTSLLLATMGGHRDVVELLLDHGADMEAYNYVRIQCLLVIFEENKRNSFTMNRMEKRR
jgi:ankyrin repeat protein